MAARLRRSFLLSKFAKRLFHKVQKKQKQTNQKNTPLFGMTGLNICTHAAYIARSVIPLMTFFVIGKRSDTHQSSRINPATKNNAIRVAPRIREMRAALRYMTEPSVPLKRRA